MSANRNRRGWRTSHVQALDMAPAFRHLSNDLALAVLRAQRCGSHLTPDTRWYCWQSHPGMELVALLDLTRQGFGAKLPLVCDRHRPPARRNGHVIVLPPPIVPLFPGYGFVPFDIKADRWRSIPSTRGVRRLFSFSSERPQPAPVGVVEAILARHGPNGYQDDAAALDALPAGSTVRVTAGPFEAHLGRITEMTPDQRVKVLLSLFGRDTVVELARRQVVEVVSVGETGIVV